MLKTSHNIRKTQIPRSDETAVRCSVSIVAIITLVTLSIFPFIDTLAAIELIAAGILGGLIWLMQHVVRTRY